MTTFLINKMSNFIPGIFKLLIAPLTGRKAMQFRTSEKEGEYLHWYLFIELKNDTVIYTRCRELIILSVGLALLTFMTSCKPLSKIGNRNTNIVTLSKDEFNKLNGTYSNNFDTTFGKVTHSPYDGWSNDKRLSILHQLFYINPESAWRDENGNIIEPKEKWIKIEFNSKKTATVSMYHNERFVFSKTIHGKFKNGCFYLRPKIWAMPLVPLLFGYNFERARLGKTTNGDLIIDYRVNRWGYALVAGSADKGFASSIYGKKK